MQSRCLQIGYVFSTLRFSHLENSFTTTGEGINEYTCKLINCSEVLPIFISTDSPGNPQMSDYIVETEMEKLSKTFWLHPSI